MGRDNFDPTGRSSARDFFQGNPRSGQPFGQEYDRFGDWMGAVWDGGRMAMGPATGPLGMAGTALSLGQARNGKLGPGLLGSVMQQVGLQRPGVRESILREIGLLAPEELNAGLGGRMGGGWGGGLGGLGGWSGGMNGMSPTGANG